jgi:hypothetical protein
MYEPWWNPVIAEEAARRAGGRRGYNATRQFRARIRREHVIALLTARGFDYGSQRYAAMALGVSPATISRDVRVLRAWLRRQGCPLWPTDLRTPKGAARIINRMVESAREYADSRE